jgi:putative ABC transport system permease protein
MSLSLQVGDTSAVKGYVTPVAKNFAKTLGIEVMSGRDLSQTERDGVVLVNEELVRRLGWDDPIGKELPFAEQSSSVGKMMASGTVIGVFSDYHFQSLRESISPLVLAPRARLGGGVNQIAVRIRAGAVPQALDVMERTWQQVAPDRPFEYTFLADNLAQQYETEQRWRSIAGYAAGLALLISCAGLFGLALLTVQRRKKEIGIRKVMGASAWNVTALVARQFAWLVAVGFALAVPLAWLGARRWLETFAYRIEVGPAPFLAAGAAVLVVAMATVGYQALRAARANPVDAIRQE